MLLQKYLAAFKQSIFSCWITKKRRQSFHKNTTPLLSRFTMALKGKYTGIFQGCSSSPPCAVLTRTELTLVELRVVSSEGQLALRKDKRGLQLECHASLKGCGTRTPSSWHLLQSEMQLLTSCFKVAISRQQESQLLQ